MSEFHFNISLSVLNHLGRNLYRSFITVIGEAISNSWDADANNVWIHLDKESNHFIIQDDGIGMTREDFQNKFLKIGYSKRKEGEVASQRGRPYIGRKGIGKLALLSCAKKIHIRTKTKDTAYVGGIIDNDQLDKDIKDDLTVDKSKLELSDPDIFAKCKISHTQGTMIYFEDINGGIKNKLEYIRVLIALYFRFSLVDESFNITLNNKSVTVDDLNDLAKNTQFLWNINNIKDPYIKRLECIKKQGNIQSSLKIHGFIASVGKPSALNIRTADERADIDIFVNGRLREKNVLRHLPDFATRHVASYLYGQIHFNELEDEEDRFTTARDAIKDGDMEYKKLLDEVKRIVKKISNQWDKWRLELRQDGDPDNKRKTRKERAITSVVNEVSKEYKPPKGSNNKQKVDSWIKKLHPDAEFNFSSYIDCFLSENLIRLYIKEENIILTPESDEEIKNFKKKEKGSKNAGNISIDVREKDDDLSYLSMDGLANLLDKKELTQYASLARDAREYKPIRDALAHTARLTQSAKDRLTMVYKNIKARLNELLASE